MRDTLDIIIRLISRTLYGKGLGKSKFLMRIYKFITKFTTSRKLVNIDGMTFDLNMGNRGLDGTTREMVVNRSYEQMTTALLKEITKEGMVAIDIGANIGYFSVLLSKLVGDTGKVISIEPEGNNLKGLYKNIRLNNCNNVLVLEKAIGNRTGLVDFYVSKDESGEHSLFPDEKRNKIVVYMDKLDNLIESKVDIIKTDTEGNEPDVLRGAERIIRSNQDIKLIVEMSYEALHKLNNSPDDIWGILKEYGFTKFRALDEIKLETSGDTFEKANSMAHKRNLDNCSVNIFCER